MDERKEERLAERKEEAQRLYEEGCSARRRGAWHEAMNLFIEAAALDPDSPAVEAKLMLDDIMNFYCRDMYNP